MKRTYKSKRGFTLIELLVVISIIAILMSVLIPSLRKARDQAKSVICLSNLKHWGLIFQMYTQDNNNSYPSGRYVYSSWMQELRMYYSDIDELRCCPTATKTWWELENGVQVNGPGASKGTYTAWGVFPDQAWYTEGDYGSYGLNCWLSDAPDEYVDSEKTKKILWRKTTKITNPNRTPLLLDALWSGVYPEATSVYYPAAATEEEAEATDPISPDSSGWWRRIYVKRHNGTNIITTDLSAQKYGLKELWFFEWHKEYAKDRALRAEPEWPAWVE